MPATKEYCLRCGNELKVKGNFCPECGYYVIRDYIEKKLLVFRMDIHGFTSLMEKTDVFVIKNLLSKVFTDLRGIAESNGGYLNQYIGDEIEILWGLVRPFSYEEFEKFLIEANNYFKKENLRIRMKMFGGYGKCIAYQIITGLKGYLILLSDFISEFDKIKDYATTQEIVLIGDVEEVFPKEKLSKKMIENMFVYSFKIPE